MANKSKYPTGCGIYAIEHVDSGKRYIGSSQNMERRLPTHVWKLRKGIHHSRHLQAAWNLYGESAFIFVLVLQCDSKEDLLYCEQLEIEMHDAVNNGFNCARFTTAPMRGRKMSEETKKKMSESHKRRESISEETRQKMREASILREKQKKERGFTVSEETRKKLSEKGKMRVFPEEVKEKIRKSNVGKKRSEEVANNIRKALLGRKLTEEHKRAISNGLNKHYGNN